MDLPEHLRIETSNQLRQRRADQMLAIARMYDHVFVVALEVHHLLDRHVAGGIAAAGAHPTQLATAFRARLGARELAQ
ncbi:hypothetical protein D3C72_1998430 [compost metagenome]